MLLRVDILDRLHVHHDEVNVEPTRRVKKRVDAKIYQSDLCVHVK